jgi:hypothetical protein
MLTSERLFSVSTAATTILALASVVVRVVVVVRLLHTFVADAYHVNGLVDYAAFDRSSTYSTFWL